MMLCLYLYKDSQVYHFFFFFSSRRRHTRLQGDWSSDVCSSDLYRTLLQIPKYGAQSESGKDFFETQLRVYVPGVGALLSFIRSKTIRFRKRRRDRKSVV